MKSPVFFIVDLSITDESAFAEYLASSKEVVESFGGRYVVRGGSVRCVEGEWNPSRFVVVEFPDEASFDRFYGSQEYSALLMLRKSSTVSNAILAPGA